MVLVCLLAAKFNNCRVWQNHWWNKITFSSFPKEFTIKTNIFASELRKSYEISTLKKNISYADENFLSFASLNDLNRKNYRQKFCSKTISNSSSFLISGRPLLQLPGVPGVDEAERVGTRDRLCRGGAVRNSGQGGRQVPGVSLIKLYLPVIDALAQSL